MLLASIVGCGAWHLARASAEVVEGQAGITPERLHELYLEYRGSETPAAVQYLRSAVEMAPEKTAWLVELAEEYEKSGRLEDALSFYRVAGEKGTKEEGLGKKIDYIEATLLARQGRIEEARRRFADLVERFPGDALLVYSLGVANLISRQYRQAEEAFKRVIAMDPAYANAYLNLATVYERQGDLEHAVEVLRNLTEQVNDTVAVQEAEIRLGLIEAKLLLDEGNLREADDLVEDLLRVAPDNVAVLSLAADIQQGLGEVVAEEELRKALLRIQPDNPLIMLRLAEIYRDTGRAREAHALLERIREKSAGSRFARQAEMLERELLAGEQGEGLREAIENEKLEKALQALEKDPSDFDALWEVSRIKVRRGAYGEAVQYLERALKIRPDNLQGRAVLASLYDQLGEFDKAVDAYAIAVAQARDEKTARELADQLVLANAKRLFANDDLARAASEFERVLARDPDNALAHFYLGLIYSRRQELTRAADQYKEVLRLLPSHVGARLNLASSFERMNREEDAIGEYRKILQSNPPPDLADEVRERLRMTERRLHGLVASLGYLMSYDDNTSLSDERKVDDYRSNLSFSLSFQHRLANGIRLRLSTMPTYEVYHEGQFDFLNTSSTISATYMPGRITLVGGYTYRTSMGLLTSNRFSRSNMYFAEFFSRVKLPRLISPFAGERIYSGITGNLSYTDFEADDSPFFSSYTTVAGVNVRQAVLADLDMSLGYSYVINDNKELIGSDYAYRSHGISGGLDWNVAPGFVVNLDLRYSRLDYQHRDSFSRFTRKRRNARYNAVLGGSYRLRRDIVLFSNVSWTRNRSNLPVGFILTPEDIVEGQQSSSLSDYDRLVYSAGINVFF